MFLIRFLFIFSIPFTFLSAKGEVSKIFAHKESAESSNYNKNMHQYKWGRGDNIIIDGFEYNGHHYNYVSESPIIKIRRVNNANASGEPCGLFAAKKSNSYNNRYKLAPTFPENCDMAKVMGGRIINIGALDLFKNGNDNYDTPKNIERVDFISPNGITAPSTLANLAKAGHVVTEKSGNNEIKIAAILSLDSNGDPASFGPLVTVHDQNGDASANRKVDYGNTYIHLADGSTIGWQQLGFYRNEKHAPQTSKPTLTGNSNEKLGMAFVSLEDLDIGVGERYYGFAYFASDVSDATNLVDYQSFPQNTPIGSLNHTDTADPYGGVASYFADEEILYDFGDAPTNYPHVSHRISNNLYLGDAQPDYETEQQSSNDATGDGADDSDGVSTLPILTVGSSSYSVETKVFNHTGQDAYITAWIDFNKNGTFEFNEALNVNNLTVHSSANTQNINITWDNTFSSSQFNGLVAGTTIMRIRLTTSRVLRCDSEHYSAGTNYGNNYFISPDGEIEDYKITIQAPPPTEISCGTVNYSTSATAWVEGTNHSRYTDNLDIPKTIKMNGTTDLRITVSGEIEHGNGADYDWIYVFDKDGNEIYKDDGELDNTPFVVSGNQVTIKLHSDGGAQGEGATIKIEGLSCSEKYDFGDAPNAYPHVSHTISNNLYLGNVKPDEESNQQSSSDATGDGIDDNDGVTALPTLAIGSSSYTVPLKVFNHTGQDAYITAWIDFNRNNQFEFNEALNVNDLTVHSSASSQNINVVWDNSFSSGQFSNLTAGTNIMRIRLSTSRVLRCDSEHYSDGGSYGENYLISPDGEVEDYQITIQSTPTETPCGATVNYSTSEDEWVEGTNHVPYNNNLDISKTIYMAGATSLRVIVNGEIEHGNGHNYDWVYIYDANGNELYKDDGNLDNTPIIISGSTARIRLYSDSGANGAGVTVSVSAIECSEENLSSTAMCYALTDNSNKLYKVSMNPNGNPLPVATTVNISTTFNGEGSAYRASNNTFYAFKGASDDEGPSDLYSIDINTGNTVKIKNDLLAGSVDGAEFYFNPALNREILYVISGENNSKLYAFDPSNNWNSLAGYPKNTHTDLSSLAIDPITGMGYAIDDYNYNSVKPPLYTINLATGATQYIVRLQNLVDAEGLAFASDGNLYIEDEGWNNLEGKKLYKVDIQTGALTLSAITNANADIEGLSCNGTALAIEYPTIKVDGNSSVVEGNSSTTALNFTVTLSEEASEDVVFSYIVNDVTTIVGEDYILENNLTATIPQGSTSTTISIQVKGDTKVEDNETLSIQIVDAQNAIIDNSPKIGTIINDDFNNEMPTPSVEYRFDECSWDGTANEVKDSSGNNLHGVAKGNADTIAQGKIGRAGYFDGSGDYVEIANDPKLQIDGDASWSLWVKPEELYRGRQGLIFKHYNNEYELIMEPGGTISFYHGDDGWEEMEEPNGAKVQENIWNHIVITRNVSNNQLTWYINGQQVGTDTYVKTPKKSTHPLTIGMRNGSSSAFKGSIDEVKLFNQELSSAQVHKIYTNENTGKDLTGEIREPINCSPMQTISCTESAFMFYKTPTDVGQLNLTSGEMSLANSMLTTTHLNAVGYNKKDNFLWGYDQIKKDGTLLRIGKDSNGAFINQEFKVANLEISSYVGDINDDGELYLQKARDVYVVDLDPSSENYLTKIRTFRLSQSLNIADWAFNPIDDQLYAVTSGTNKLYKINPNDGTVSFVRNTEVNENSPFGASFFDKHGNFYFYSNGTGNIYKIDTQSSSVASLFSHASIVAKNDGAMCSDIEIAEPAHLSINSNQEILEGDSGTKNLTFTISLDKAVDNNISFDYQIIDGNSSNAVENATAPSDYIANSTPTHVVIQGDSITYTLNVTIKGDTTIEDNEKFTLLITNIQGATGSDGNQTKSEIRAIGTIINDDSAVSVGTLEDLDEDNDGVLDEIEYGEHPNLIQNPSFESDNFSNGTMFPNASTSMNGTFFNHSHNNNPITGWSYEGGVDGIIEGTLHNPTPHGQQYIDLQGDMSFFPHFPMSSESKNRLYQTISTLPGKKYRFSFWLRAKENLMSAMVFGKTILNVQVSDPINNSVLSNRNFNEISQTMFPFPLFNQDRYDWTKNEIFFEATSTQTTISFATDRAMMGFLVDVDIDMVSVKEVSDSDTDGIPDFLDLDSDNDGIADTIEIQTTQDYIKPSYQFDTNGVDIAFSGGFTPVDTDEDNISDYLDLDSDNDGLFDIQESGLGNNDTDNDGRTNSDVGTNGLDNNITHEKSDTFEDINGMGYEEDIFRLKDSDLDTNLNGSNALPMGRDFDYRDNSQPYLYISNEEALEGNSGEHNLTFTISLDSPAGAGISFDWQVFEGNSSNLIENATSPSDYTTIETLNHVTLSGTTQIYTFSISIKGDSIVEDDEKFQVRITNIRGAVGEDITAIGTIINDDSAISWGTSTDLDEDNDGILDEIEFGNYPNLVQNPSFEADDCMDTSRFPDGFTGRDGTFLGDNYNNNQITGWNYTSNIDCWVEGHSFAMTDYGTQYIDLQGNINVHGSGSWSQVAQNHLTQTITTIPGKTYRFSFQWGEDVGHKINEPIVFTMKVIDEINQTMLSNETLHEVAGGRESFPLAGPNTWYTYEAFFVATSTQTKLDFSATPPAGNLSAGADIDMVSVKEVADSDEDGVPDFLDLDSDNDGIPDNIETQTTQNYIKPSHIFNDDGVDVAFNGGFTPVDTDDDNISDYLDLDSDNDSIFDIEESGLGNNDSDNDGRTNYDVGINGLDNALTHESNDTIDDVNGMAYDGSIFFLKDSDLDTDANGLNALSMGTDFDYRDNSHSPILIQVNNLEKKEGDSGATNFVIPVTLNRPAPIDIILEYTPTGDLVYSDDFADGLFDEFFAENPEESASNPNDPLTVRINDARIKEGNEGTKELKFKLKLSKQAPQGGVTVVIEPHNVTATEGEDYTRIESSVYFAPGEVIAYATFIINGDTTKEETETFEVELIYPMNAELHPHSTAIGTIENDDGYGWWWFFKTTSPKLSYKESNLPFIQIKKGETIGNIYIPVQGDITVEDNEPFDLVFETVPFMEFAKIDTEEDKQASKIGQKIITITILNDDENLSENLVAEYRMDECAWSGTIKDVLDHKNNLNGIAQGSANTINDGKIGRAGSFSNNTDFVQVDDLNLSTPFSVTAWLKNNSNNSWYQAVIVNDGNVSSFYIDGELDPTITKDSPEIPDFFTSLKDITFNGQVDEVKFFSTILKSHHVKNIYDNENAGRNWDDNKTRGAIACIPPKNIGEYRFDCFVNGGYPDYSDINNPITTTIQSEVRENSPIMCNGVEGNNSAITVIDNNSYHLDRGSLSFWIHPKDTLNNNDYIITKSGFKVGFKQITDTEGAIEVTLEDGTKITSSTRYDLSNPQWMFITIIFEKGAKAKLYINSLLEAEATYDNSFNNNSDIQVAHYRGQFDEFYLFDSAFSQAQINNLYQEQLDNINLDGIGRVCDCSIMFPFVSISDVKDNEGDSGLTTFTFNVTLNNPAPADASLRVRLHDGTNANNSLNALVSDNDYLNNNQIIPIPFEAKTFEINISVKGDTHLERDESFSIELYDLVNLMPTDIIGEATIVNDDMVWLNIERKNSATLYNQDQDIDKKFNLYTQIAKKDFDYSIVAYALNGNNEEKGLSDLTVKVELINQMDSNDSTNVMQTVVRTFENNQSRIDVPMGEGLKDIIATKYASFRISYPVDVNNTVIPDNSCTTVECLERLNGFDHFESTYSKDGFAIRPAGFKLMLWADDGDVRDDLATNTQQNGGALAAGYEYELQVQALGYTDHIEIDYNPEKYYLNPPMNTIIAPTQEVNASLLFDDNITQCANTEDKELKYYKFIEGVNKQQLFSHDEVGHYIIKVKDANWTNSDHSTHLSQQGCIVGSTNNEPDNNGMVGCNIATDFRSKNDLYYDMKVYFQPYYFDINLTATSQPNSGHSNFLYMSNLKKSKKMAILIEGNITAKDKNGHTTTNFTENCLAQKVEFSLNYSADTNKGIFNNQNPLELVTTKGTPIAIQRRVSHNSEEFSNVTTNALDNNITLSKNDFKTDKNGATEIAILYNIDKSLSETINPIKLEIKQAHVKSKDAGSNLADNETRTFFPSGEQNLTTTTTFYFTRVASDTENYPITYGDSELTPLNIEIFCEQNTTWCQNMIGKNGEYTLNRGWYTSIKHENDTDGKIIGYTKPDGVDVNDSMSFVEGRIENLKTLLTHNSEDNTIQLLQDSNRTSIQVDINASSWLLYHPVTKDGIPFWRNHFHNSSEVSGIGNLGHIIDTKINTRPSAKMDW